MNAAHPTFPPSPAVGKKLTSSPYWHYLAALGTLLEVLFTSATIIVIGFCGLLIFAGLGGFPSEAEEGGPSLRSLLFIASFALCFVALLISYSAKPRLWPLLIMLLVCLAGLFLSFPAL